VCEEILTGRREAGGTHVVAVGLSEGHEDVLRTTAFGAVRKEYSKISPARRHTNCKGEVIGMGARPSSVVRGPVQNRSEHRRPLKVLTWAR